MLSYIRKYALFLIAILFFLNSPLYAETLKEALVKINSIIEKTYTTDAVKKKKALALVDKILKAKVDDKEKIQRLSYLKEVLSVTVPEQKKPRVKLIKTEKKPLKVDSDHIPTKREIFKNIVIIKGSRSSGSGFIAKFANTPVVISNVHVFIGNKKIKLMTTAGKVIDFKAIYFAKKYDLVFYILKNPEKVTSYLNIERNFETNVTTGSPVVVFGNSLGGNVATELPGEVQGIGPEIVEVSSKFVHGNSGSPIILKKTGKVIGVATFALKENPHWVTKGTRFAGVRRFGLRVDKLGKRDLVKLNMKQYILDLRVYDELAKSNKLGIQIIQDLQKDFRLTPGAYKNLRIAQLIPRWNRGVKGYKVSGVLANSKSLSSILTPSLFAIGRTNYSTEAMKRRIEAQKKLNKQVLQVYKNLTNALKDLFKKNNSGYRL